MSEQPNASPPAPPEHHTSKLVYAIVIIGIGLSVVMTLMQIFGPDSWKAFPMFGPESDFVATPQDATQPADAADTSGGSTAPDANGAQPQGGQ